MRYRGTRTGISRQDLAQDARSGATWRGAPACTVCRRIVPGGYRNRRFAIIRNAAWITLYRARLPVPQIGVLLRCTGLAGEAFFTLADHVRDEIEPQLQAEIGSNAAIEWGVSHHPGMIDIAAILAAPLPWNDRAAGQHVAWMLRVGAIWWNCFVSLAGGSAAEGISPTE
jgi:hypothetical protein